MEKIKQLNIITQLLLVLTVLINSESCNKYLMENQIQQIISQIINLSDQSQSNEPVFSTLYGEEKAKPNHDKKVNDNDLLKKIEKLEEEITRLKFQLKFTQEELDKKKDYISPEQFNEIKKEMAEKYTKSVEKFIEDNQKGPSKTLPFKISDLLSHLVNLNLAINIGEAHVGVGPNAWN